MEHDAGQERFLHLNMRPLTSRRARPSGRGPLPVVAWIVITIAAVFVVLVVGPFVLFFLVAGEPFGRMYVEHREDGFYLGRRSCDPTPVRTVAMSVYDESVTRPAPVVWTATATGQGATTLRLLAPDDRYETHVSETDLGPRTYTVLVDAGTDEHNELVVDLATIPLGRLDFGEGRAVTPAAYARMPDGDFGC